MIGKRKLVTGGAGFIGSHLVDALLALGERVRVLDDFSSGRRSNLPEHADLEVVQEDIRDIETCRRAASGCDVVFHQAALGSVPRSVLDPGATWQVNATGTVNVLIAAREAGVARVVYASSSSVYGDDPSLPKTEDRVGSPLSPYAASKRANELAAAAFSRSYGLQTVGLRYFNVFGPRQDPDSPYAAVIPLFLRAARERRPARIHGDGGQTRDFTYVSDVVTANLLAGSAVFEPGFAGVFNIGAGGRTSILELWRIVGEIAGYQAPPEHAPPRPGDVRDSSADISRARQLLGFSPSFDLRRGLAATAGSLSTA